MAKREEEIEDADLDEQENSDEEEDTDEDEDESDEDESEDDGDESEEDEEDDSDSDDDDDKPLTRKDLKKILSKEANRRGASQRTSGKKRDLPDRARSSDQKENERLDKIEQKQRKLDQLEKKRQFGYENDLSPDEVDVVFRLTKRPSAKTLTDPIVKGALEGYREAKRVRSNTPRTNGKANRAGATKTYKDLPVGKERSTAFANRRQDLLAAKRGNR